MDKLKIGILGGSFNPAHLGHIHISLLALQKLQLQQIWWIPTAQNPLKKEVAAPYKQRFAACLEITKNHPKIYVKDFANHSIITYNLIRRIKALHPRDKFYFIVGDDILPELHKWNDFQKLLKLVPFAVFARHGNVKNPRINANSFLKFYTQKNEISSTAIRKQHNS